MEEEKKDSFVFFRSFYEGVLNLPKENQTEIILAICEYSLNGKIPDDLSAIGKAMFTVIKPNVDNATKRYKASVENGKKGGRPRKSKVEDVSEENLEKPNQNLKKPNNNLTETKTKPNQNLNVNVDDNVNDNNKENILKEKPTTKKFIKPTLEEIKQYCSERKNKVDPNKFIDYYESNGWKVGKNPMKDWKAAVRTWERSNFNSSNTTVKSSNTIDWNEWDKKHKSESTTTPEEIQRMIEEGEIF